ncbi:MAG: right-handed parallel beta-helix repeat-containing protein [Planctomycetota bacterium]
MVCSWALLGSAGDLNPPAPPGPTMKTLDEVEARSPVQSLSGSGSALYVIDQSGSYYLTGNIYGETDKHGILITADDVTVDLNGYSLIGMGKAVGTSEQGISASGYRVTILNGSVSQWISSGITLGGRSNIVKNVKASENGIDGISVGFHSTITNCVARNNGNGIITNKCSVVNGCSAYSNDNKGIECAAGSVISHSATGQNITGIIANACSVITYCTAYDNASDGINTSGDGCTVTYCTAYSNGNDGISVNNGSSVIGCTAYNNVHDGFVATQSLITNNTAYNNSPNWNLSSCTTPNNHPAP